METLQIQTEGTDIFKDGNMISGGVSSFSISPKTIDILFTKIVFLDVVCDLKTEYSNEYICDVIIDYGYTCYRIRYKGETEEIVNYKGLLSYNLLLEKIKKL